MPFGGWQWIRIRHKHYSSLTINFRNLLKNSISTTGQFLFPFQPDQWSIAPALGAIL